MENPKFHNSTSIKPKTSFAPWRARTCTALVVDRGSWIVNSWYGFHRAQWLWSSGFLGFAVLDGVAVLVSPCLMVWYGFCRAQHLVGFWVSPCWLWSGCDMSFLGFAVLCGAGLAVLWVAVWWSFSDGETEMRDRDERWETEERESNKILLFFYNTYYNAILCLELHCI